MSPELIAAAQERDQQDAEINAQMQITKPFSTVRQRAVDIWVKAVGQLRRLLRL
jgi:hypothetical protein